MSLPDLSAGRRNLFSSVFSLAIIASALFVTQRFVLPLLWAVILCIATWPLFLRVLRACRGHHVAAAAATTLISALVFVTPLVLGVVQAAHQAPALAAMVADANNAGIGAPQWLLKIPMAGTEIHDWWVATLGQPHGLAHLLQDGSIARLHSASEVLRSVGANALHRMIDVGFAFMALFFFYKDGLALRSQVSAIGDHLIGTARWTLYSTKIPTAVRATVNGLVLVGLAEGVLLGIAYELAGVPSAVLWAAATGVLAIIPFGAPLAFWRGGAGAAAQGQHDCGHRHPRLGHGRAVRGRPFRAPDHDRECHGAAVSGSVAGNSGWGGNAGIDRPVRRPGRDDLVRDLVARGKTIWARAGVTPAAPQYCV